MSGFQNPLHMTANTFQVVPLPNAIHASVTPTWVDGTAQTFGFPNSYVSSGYQQLNGQIIYPVNVVQNSPGYISTINHNHIPHTFQEGLHSHNPMWGQSSIMFHGSQNMVSPVTLASPLVTNPQFLPHTFQNPPEQLLTQAVGVTSQIAPGTYGPTQQQQQQLSMSLTQLNAGYQQQQMLLLLQQQQQEQKQKQEEEEQKKLEHLMQQQQIQHLQQQLQKQQEQQQRLQLIQEQQINHQQIRLSATSEISNQVSLNDRTLISGNETNRNITSISGNDTKRDITKIQTESITHSIPLGDKNTLTSVQDISPQISAEGSVYPRLNTFPITLPTSLNPSLQIRSQSSLVESASSQKAAQGIWQPPSTSLKDVGLNKMNGTKMQPPSTSLNEAGLNKMNETNMQPPSTSLNEAGLNKMNETKMNETKMELQVSQSVSRNGSLLPSIASSPETSTSLFRTDLTDHFVHKPVYDKPKHKHDCLRCNKKVYHMEKVGPIKDVIYHKSCLTCVRCGTALNVKNFHHNPNDPEDLSVFCVSHKPKEKTRSCDANAVYIKSALTAPKLDRINEQIRSDRQPSEVLARPGYLQPAPSAMTTAREHFYYGMQQLTEDTKLDGKHQQQQQKQIKTLHYEIHPTQPQREEQLKETKQTLQHEQQKNHKLQMNSHHVQDQQLRQEHHDDLQQHNIQMQERALENDNKLVRDLANIKLSQNRETNILSSSGMAGTRLNETLNDVSLSRENRKTSPAHIGDVHVTKSSTPALTSLLSSAIIHQEITPEASVEEYLATHFQLDNHSALLKQNHSHGASLKQNHNYSVSLKQNHNHDASLKQNHNHSVSLKQNHNHVGTEELQMMPERNLVSIQSSRSTSPMHIQTSSKSTDDNESCRSSFSSNLSSRESVDLGASATTYTQLQHSANDRADRPSAFQKITGYVEPNAHTSIRMVEKNQMNQNVELKQPNVNMDRFLPKNERMRLDRPSQFS